MPDNIKIKIDIALDPAGVDSGAAQTQARLDKLAEAMTASFQKSADAERQVTDESKKLDEQQKNLGGTLDGLASKIGAYTVGWNVAADAVRYAAGAVKDYIKESALLNARYETMGVVLEVVGRNAGYSKGEMEAYTEGVRKSGITMIESRESIVRMVQANLDLSNASKLARAAQDAAVIGNINSSEAFGRLIYAIQSAQPEMLRTLGINVNFESGYKKLAQQLKVNIDQLTEQEKAQSRVNTVMEASTRIAGTYEGAMTTAGKMMTSLARYSEDLKVMRGEVFNDALVIAVNTYTDALKDANDETRRLSSENKLREWGKDIVYTFAYAGDVVSALWRGLEIGVESAAVAVVNSMNFLRKGALAAFPGAGMIAGLLGSGTGHDIDAMVESFTDQANAAMKRQANRPNLWQEADAWYKKRDADAAERAMQQREDARDLALGKSMGLRYGSAPQGRAGANGPGKADQDKARREAEWVAQKQLEGEQEDVRTTTEAWQAYDKTITAKDKEVERQNKLLDDQAQRWKDLVDPTAKYERQFDELLNLWNQGKLSNEEYAAAFEKVQESEEKLFKFAKEKNPFDDLQKSIEGWGRGFSKTMGEAVVTFDFSTKKMGGAFKSLLADIAAQQIQKNFTDPVVKAAGSALGQLFGASEWVSQGHTGAIAGVESTPRLVPAGTFAGARRMHSGGLAANEVPMILERDEEVLTRSDPRHRYNQGASGAGTFSPTLVFNVDNKGSQPMQVKQSGPATMTNGKLVVGLLLEELGSNQSSRNALAGVLR